MVWEPFMVNHFDELIKMWHDTTDDHVDWQKKAKTISVEELFSYIRDLSKKKMDLAQKQSI